jgi:hypothetical protein
MQAVRRAVRTGLPATAAVAVLLALVPSAAGAGARYAPPGNKIYAGVSDSGRKQDYFDFSAQADQHVPVLQSFVTWGAPVDDALRLWRKTETRGTLSVSTSPCYQCHEVISPRQIRRGRGDNYLVGLNATLAGWGKPTYIRLLPEMNGHWNPYAAFDADGDSRGPDHRTTQFRKAWQRSVLILRGGPRKLIDRRLRRLGMPPVRRSAHPPGKLPRPRISFLWVPQTHGSPNIRANMPDKYWPGAKYVDWVGADIYGKFPNFTGLEGFYRDFKRKPFVIGEWSPWDSDDPGFVDQLFRWVETHRRAKMLIYFQGFGDPNPFQIQIYPKSAEAMRHQMRGPRFVDSAP